MSASVRIHTYQSTNRPSASNRTRARNLLYSSNPPPSPFAKGTECDALEASGRPCSGRSSSQVQPWCDRHLKEMEVMNAEWKQALRAAEAIPSLVSPEQAKQKVSRLDLAATLRRQVSDRFFKQGGDTEERLEWVNKFERDVRGLAELDQNIGQKMINNIAPSVATTPGSALGSALGSAYGAITISLDPDIPLSDYQQVPDYETLLVFKQFYAEICSDAVQRLYSIVPDLNDSVPKGSGMEDGGTDIVRAWFRLMVLKEADPEQLLYASQAASIDEYLHKLYASQLEIYIEFFKKAWHPHALSYLRVAICGAHAAKKVKTIPLLGGLIPSTSEGLKMTKPCWDILYHWFPTLLTPWSLPDICETFEEYCIVNKLMVTGLYQEHWYDPDASARLEDWRRAYDWRRQWLDSIEEE